MAAIRKRAVCATTNPVEHASPISTLRVQMLKTFSLSLLFILALGLVVAAYATIPA
jgi:hypothetical protein